MKKIILILLLLNIVYHGDAQYYRVVKDPGLNGQLKRMVDQDWNDWQPDPTWKFFGLIPRDPTGALMWGVLNRSYWKGDDLRPYKLGGQFQQNLVSLRLEKSDAEKTADSSEAIAKQQMATYINMLGGAGDIAYSLYFKDKFNTELESFKSEFERVLLYRPQAYELMKKQERYKIFQNEYEVILDRIETIHQAFMEKGARIEAYFNILNDLQAVVGNAAFYCKMLIDIDKKNQIALKKKQFEINKEYKPAKSDKEIVNRILINNNF